MVRRKVEKTIEWLLIIGIVLSVALIFSVNIFHFNYVMDSDIASEVVLGKLIWDEKELVPSTWYSSTETRVITTPNVAAVFYGLTKNMVLSEGLACCLMTILILASIFYFGKKAELKNLETLLLAFLGLVLPVNMVILELLYFFASYYAIHVVVLFFSLGVYVEGISKKKITWMQIFLSIMLAFCLGVQGVRGILVLYGPLLSVEVIRMVYRCFCKVKNEKRDWIISIWVVSLLAVSYIGTCFSFSTGQEFSRNIRRGLPKLFTVVFPNMMETIGGNHVSACGKVLLCFALLTLVGMLAYLVYCMWRKHLIQSIDWAFLVFCTSPLMTALMIAFTTIDDSVRYYFLLTFAMSFAVVLLWRKLSDRWKLVGITLIVIFGAINICVVYTPIMTSEDPPETDTYAVGKYLVEKDYEIAYATFENANIITALTNGEVQVAAVASVDKMDICKWLTSTNWYVPNRPFEEKTAYIITETEMKSFESFLEGHKTEMNFVQKIGKYLIYTSNYNYSVM